MASEKSERLVNLVIALLATKKYLTKNQIFSAVPGYEGTPDSKDRMFERDKEDLRAIGINIEMKSIDPLFEDEIGYRIQPDRFKLDLGDLTPEEVSLLAIANEAWRESALNGIANSTAIRLESLGISADFSELAITPNISNAPEHLYALFTALESNKVIEIQYLNAEEEIEKRLIGPLSVYSQRGRWYLGALDQDKKEIRTFRIDRIVGDLKRTQRIFDKIPFEIPTTFFPQLEVLFQVRRDQVPYLLRGAQLVQDEGDWLTYRKNFESFDVAKSEILSAGSNAKVLQPISLVSSITKSLNELISIHD